MATILRNAFNRRLLQTSVTPLSFLGLTPHMCFSTASSRRQNKVHYPIIPDWQRTQYRDPFDYQLRSPEEVRQQHVYFPPDFNV